MSKLNSALELTVLERIRSGNHTQNFSAILNSPEEPVSYYQGFKNMLYYSVYADDSSVDFELSKDIEKFSTVDIGSPRSLSSGHSAKISFKELLNENMDMYINTIKPEYEKYKVNHYHPNRKSNDTNNSNSISNNNSHVSIMTERNQIYQSNSYVLKSIDKEFNVNEKEFKIQKDLLSQKKEFITHSNHELIEKCGRIELELEKTLDFTHKMSHYISLNLSPLENYVNGVYNRINKWKEMMNTLKLNILSNSTQLLLKGIKAKNSKRVLLYLDKYKQLREVIELLKILSTNQKKYKLALELISKGKELITKLRLIDSKNKHQPSLKLLSLFEEELNKYSLKCCEQINTEFNTALVDSFKHFIAIDNTNENTITYDIDKHSYDKLVSSSQENSTLLNKITFPNTDTSKIKQMIQLFISNEVIDALCLKIRSLMLQVANETLKSSIALIKAEMSSNENTNSVLLENNKATVTIIADIEKNEQIMLLLIIKCKEKLITAIREIYKAIEEVLNEVTETYKGIEKLKNGFKEEFYEIDREIETICSNILETQLIKCLQEALAHSNIDAYVDNYYLVRNIMKSLIKLETNSNNVLFEKCEGDYIQKWLNSKESKFKSPLYENWEHFTEIPFNYQSNLDMVLKYQLNQDKAYIDSISLFQDQDSINTTNGDQLPYLLIKEFKIKANQCSLDIIKASFEFIKMLTLFSSKSWNAIITSYTMLITHYLTYHKEQIFDGRYSSVTQTEISMVFSISLLIQEIIISLLQNDSKRLIQNYTTTDVYYNLKDDLLSSIRNMLYVSKGKILDLIDKYVIETSLKELYIIKLPNYPIAEGEVPINAYALSLVKLLHSIYEAMINSYDNDFIIKTVTDALNKFFERFEKYIFNGEKIDKEGSLKQFRRDMIFLKKNFGYLNLIDINGIKARIDNINKTVLPEAVRVTTNSSNHKEKNDSNSNNSNTN